MSASAEVALVTGGNTGIGHAVVAGLAEAGLTVWLGSRSAAAGQRAAAELDGPGEIRVVQLDVTDDDSVTAAVATVTAGGRLDVLVNNAGISGSRPTVPETTCAHVTDVLAVNLLGVVRTTQALLPLLRRAPAGRIVNVSSGRGSFAATSDPERLEHGVLGLPYPVSKAALNMLTHQYAKAYPELRINAVDPGYTATAINDFAGTATPRQGAEPIITLAVSGVDGPTGGLFDRAGPLGW